MNKLDQLYKQWSENKTGENLDHVLSAVTLFVNAEEDTVSDEAQNTVLWVWEKIGSFSRTHENSFRNWVSSGAKFCRLSIARDNARHCAKHVSFTGDSSSQQMAIATPKKLRDYRKTFDSLSPFMQEWIVGRLEGKKDQALAQEMGPTYEALRQRLSYHRKKLRGKTSQC